MSELRIVGAGLGRTGTHSLKLALERLLGAPCYHMAEVFKRPDHIPAWHAAARGQPVDWRKLFDGYAAAVDWPASAFWPQIAETFPNAIILLSSRSADSWWKSASRTIFEHFARGAGGPEPLPGWRAMMTELFANTFTPSYAEEAAAKAAFDLHNVDVRTRAPAARLVDWRAQDGWGPLCAALKIPIPDEPFPVSNTTEQFRAQTHLDG
jgi:hypothetical protein